MPLELGSFRREDRPGDARAGSFLPEPLETDPRQRALDSRHGAPDGVSHLADVHVEHVDGRPWYHGIVRDISHVLARQGINIEELETSVAGAAMSGELLFRARARVCLPETRSVGEIREILEALADNLMVDLVFDDADSVAERR